MSPRGTKTLPDVQPILLMPRRDPFDDPAWLFEPKYDGYRGLLYVTRQECWFRSKRGNVLKRFQDLCYWVREQLPVKEAILDGEVVAIDSEGRQNFHDLRVGRGNLHYAAFDALWIEGKDLRPLPTPCYTSLSTSRQPPRHSAKPSRRCTPRTGTGIHLAT